MLQGLMVYGLVDGHKMAMAPLGIAKWIKAGLVVLSWLAVLASIGRWFVGFYFAIRFDYLHRVRLIAIQSRVPLCRCTGD